VYRRLVFLKILLSVCVCGIRRLAKLA